MAHMESEQEVFEIIERIFCKESTKYRLILTLLMSRDAIEGNSSHRRDIYFEYN